MAHLKNPDVVIPDYSDYPDDYSPELEYSN